MSHWSFGMVLHWGFIVAICAGLSIIVIGTLLLDRRILRDRQSSPSKKLRALQRIILISLMPMLVTGSVLHWPHSVMISLAIAFGLGNIYHNISGVKTETRYKTDILYKNATLALSSLLLIGVILSWPGVIMAPGFMLFGFGCIGSVYNTHL